MKKSLKPSTKIIFVICILISILSIIVWYFFDNYKYTYEEYSGEYQNYYITYKNNNYNYEYYLMIYYRLYNYKNSEFMIIKNYDTYSHYIEIIENDNPVIYNSNIIENVVSIKGLEESFFEDKSLILCFANGLLDVQENDNTADILLYKNGFYVSSINEEETDTTTYTYGFNVYFIPVSKDITKINVNYESEPTFSTEKNICKAIIAISICIMAAMQIPNINRILKQYSKQIKTAIKNILNGVLIIWMIVNLLYAFYVLYSNVIGALEFCYIGIYIGLSIFPVIMIYGIKKGNKVVKNICVILTIFCVIIEIMFGIMIYNNTKETVSAKPIIYLYPEEETEVSVELEYPENITVSYPKYETGWNILAKPDGNLIDLETGKNLYSLYYENTNTYNFEVTSEGFIVKGEDVTEFLEEKLAILGLNERESEEFIIYWLPVLQENEYNYIRFATTEEIEENMPLTINPNPDTIIRLLMTYKGLESPIEVEEQELETPERTGFVAVEWGGTEIK